MSKLLIIADEENRRQVALHRGVALAKALSLDVDVVVYCHEYLEDLEAGLQSKVKAAVISEKTKWLDRQLASVDCKGVKLTTYVEWEKTIHNAVIARCTQHSYAFVVKAGHRTERFLYTPTDWHLLRHCKTPVFICASQKWKSKQPILAAVDLMSSKRSKKQLDQRVLEQAFSLASALNAPLHIVCAMPVPAVLRDLDVIDMRQYAADKKKQLEPIVADLIERYGLTKKQVHLTAGPAHKVIPSMANRIKADLVVIGSVGRAGVRGAIKGNTAEKVLEYLRTDVLSVK